MAVTFHCPECNNKAGHFAAAPMEAWPWCRIRNTTFAHWREYLEPGTCIIGLVDGAPSFDVRLAE